jgi:hypothetical protein
MTSSSSRGVTASIPLPPAVLGAKGLLTFNEQSEAEFEELKVNDPIAAQDAYNTSLALEAAVRDSEAGQGSRAVAEVLYNSEPGDFVPLIVHRAFLECCRNADPDVMYRLLITGGLVIRGVPALGECVREVCAAAHAFSQSPCSVEQCRFGQGMRCLQHLYTSGADFNVWSPSDGLTPLSYAIRVGNPPLVYKVIFTDGLRTLSFSW